MKKCLALAFLALVLIPLTLATNLEVEQIEKEPVVIAELDNPAKLLFQITNNDLSDTFEMYSLIESSLSPKTPFFISEGETKGIEVTIDPFPRTRKNIRGFYLFEYEIKGQKTGIFRDRIKLKIVELKDAFEITAQNIIPGDRETILSITNKENFNFNSTKISLDSQFFNIQKTIQISPNEQINITVPINSDSTKGLSAGTYDIEAIIENQGKKAEIKGEIKFLEKEGISVSESSKGFIIRDKTITKTNEGNVPITAVITQKKDILTRLFTLYSQEPNNSEKTGLFIEYVWEKEISPAESFILTTTTNYTIPFILIVIVIIIGILVKSYTSNSLSLQKRVSFVKTKGGEFALRVRIRAKARKHIEDIELVDKIPTIVKIYEKFGRKPDKIDHRTRRIFWSIPKLDVGEERVFSYIVYSKIKVIGRFELPAARASYKRKGVPNESYSNRTSFVAETSDTIPEH